MCRIHNSKPSKKGRRKHKAVERIPTKALDLVSGARDRVHLNYKFRDAYETSFPGSIKELILEPKQIGLGYHILIR
ncbi:hypothetical protein EJ110_NYTH27729 [Nymphaea thermarum]|nr:hypothetical protein EJ110_NYTH27729 [Nymphaea thermarum]